MRALDSTRCATSAAPLMASSIAVFPAPVTGTGSKVPSGRGMQVQRPCRLVCGTIAVVLGVIVQSRCRGFRNVSRRCQMPRFLYPSDAPFDPALVFLAQFGLADLKDLARPDAEFLDLFRHHRGHVHDPIALERVHDLFAIASFDTFAIVPAEGYFDWGVGVESQNSIRHCCSPCSSFRGSSSISSSPSSSSSARCGSTSRPSSGSSSPHPDWPYVQIEEGVPHGTLLCGRDSGHDGGRQARESGTGARRRCPPIRESARIG